MGSAPTRYSINVRVLRSLAVVVPEVLTRSGDPRTRRKLRRPLVASIAWWETVASLGIVIVIHHILLPDLLVLHLQPLVANLRKNEAKRLANIYWINNSHNHSNNNTNGSP
jgi:hypothetical protein